MSRLSSVGLTWMNGAEGGDSCWTLVLEICCGSRNARVFVWSGHYCGVCGPLDVTLKALVVCVGIRLLYLLFSIIFRII